jgi:hypothetical protein
VDDPTKAKLLIKIPGEYYSLEYVVRISPEVKISKNFQSRLFSAVTFLFT